MFLIYLTAISSVMGRKRDTNKPIHTLIIIIRSSSSMHQIPLQCMHASPVLLSIHQPYIYIYINQVVSTPSIACYHRWNIIIFIKTRNLLIHIFRCHSTVVSSTYDHHAQYWWCYYCSCRSPLGGLQHTLACPSC